MHINVHPDSCNFSTFMFDWNSNTLSHIERLIIIIIIIHKRFFIKFICSVNSNFRTMTQNDSFNNSYRPLSIEALSVIESCNWTSYCYLYLCTFRQFLCIYFYRYLFLCHRYELYNPVYFLSACKEFNVLFQEKTFYI